MGDFWGAGGAMSGLACILAMQGVDRQAATYFGAASVLMGRVGGSLLPSELMTHQEAEAELQARMPAALWHAAFTAGASEPDRVVEQALAVHLSFHLKSGEATAPPQAVQPQPT